MAKLGLTNTDLTLGGTFVTTIGAGDGVGAFGRLTVADNAQVTVDGGKLYAGAKITDTDSEGIEIAGGVVTLKGDKTNNAVIATSGTSGVASVTHKGGSIAVTGVGVIGEEETGTDTKTYGGTFDQQGGTLSIAKGAFLTVKAKTWNIAGAQVVNNSFVTFDGGM